MRFPSSEEALPPPLTPHHPRKGQPTLNRFWTSQRAGKAYIKNSTIKRVNGTRDMDSNSRAINSIDGDSILQLVSGKLGRHDILTEYELYNYPFFATPFSSLTLPPKSTSTHLTPFIAYPSSSFSAYHNLNTSSTHRYHHLNNRV